MNTADKQIADILGRYGEPFAGNVWRVSGNAVIYHKALERIAAQAKIEFERPQVLRAERDEAVLLVTGHIPATNVVNGTSIQSRRTEWSIGEALVNVNYKVSGKQPAFVYAMAEKRAKDRVILKLIELHGLVYSEEEADEFKESAQNNNSPTQDSIVSDAERRASDLKRKISALKTTDVVTDFMTQAETQTALADLPQALKDQVRDHAKARMVALGWTPTKKEAGAQPQ